MEQGSGSRAQIYTVKADGSETKQLTSSGEYYSPSWSPDGRRIAFSSGIPFPQIFVMDDDGSHRTQLTTAPANRAPDWSRDGRRIVFLSSREEGWQVWVMNADGSGQTRLTSRRGNEAPSGDPVWAPDSNRIAFTAPVASGPIRTTTGTSTSWAVQIFVINADGSGLKRLTGP